jgi:predicted DNA-binding transcriptional regulator AlpA
MSTPARSRPSSLPPSLPPRLVSAVQGAEFLNISTNKFYQLVGEGRLPRPVKIDRRNAWDVLDLHAAVDRMKSDPVDAADEFAAADDGWEDIDAG